MACAKQQLLLCSVAEQISYHPERVVRDEKHGLLASHSLKPFDTLCSYRRRINTTMAPRWTLLPAALFGVLASLSVFLPSAEAGCCPNACSGHGTCTVDDACVCYSNWQVRERFAVRSAGVCVLGALARVVIRRCLVCGMMMMVLLSQIDCNRCLDNEARGCWDKTLVTPGGATV